MFDASCAGDIALVETRKEFLRRYMQIKMILFSIHIAYFNLISTPILSYIIVIITIIKSSGKLQH